MISRSRSSPRQVGAAVGAAAAADGGRRRPGRRRSAGPGRRARRVSPATARGQGARERGPHGGQEDSRRSRAQGVGFCIKLLEREK